MEIGKKEAVRSFELVVYVRDHKGKPTDKKVSKSSDEAYDISDFWNKHKPTKKKKRAASKVASKKQAEKTLKGMYKDNA
jgi:hypothetical protein